MSVHYIRILFVAFPLVGFQIVVTQFFQSIGIVKKSIFLSLSRQLIFLIPSLLVLPHFYGVDGVFMSIPVGDVLATFTTALLFIIEMRKFKKRDAIT